MNGIILEVIQIEAVKYLFLFSYVRLIVPKKNFKAFLTWLWGQKNTYGDLNKLLFSSAVRQMFADRGIL